LKVERTCPRNGASSEEEYDEEENGKMWVDRKEAENRWVSKGRVIDGLAIGEPLSPRLARSDQSDYSFGSEFLCEHSDRRWDERT